MNSNLTETGPFGKAARQYVEAGLLVIPIDEFRTPKVAAFEKTGRPRALAWASNPRLAPFNIAIRCGRRSGLTVVDLDHEPEHQASALKAAEERFGPAAIVVRTASGKHHLWYAWNGEGRHIKRLTDLDVIGAGIVIAPPSVVTAKGRYDFIRGDLSSLHKLTPIKPGSLPTSCCSTTAPSQAATRGTVLEGRRDKELFFRARGLAGDCLSEPELLEALRAKNNETCVPPLPDSDVSKIARTVWRYAEAGTLKAPGGQKEATILLPRSAIYKAARDPAAFVVECIARVEHEALPRDRFAMPTRWLAGLMGGNANKAGATIKRVLARGTLHRIRAGGSCEGDAAQYRLNLAWLADMRAKSAFQGLAPTVSETDTNTDRYPAPVALAAAAATKLRSPDNQGDFIVAQNFGARPREASRTLSRQSLQPTLPGLEVSGALIDLNELRRWRDGKMPRALAAATRHAMQEFCMNQDAVAAAVGISRPQLSNVLQGRFGTTAETAKHLKMFILEGVA